VALADMPEIPGGIIAELIRALERAGSHVAVPVFQDRNGHPVVIDRTCRKRLLRLGGDVGARDLIREHPEMVERVETAHRGVVYDVDTAEDVEPRRLVFDNDAAFRDAAAALSRAGIWFEAADEATETGRGPAKIGYHVFDEPEVTALCQGGRKAVR
jgi:hypothetical protein